MIMPASRLLAALLLALSLASPGPAAAASPGTAVGAFPAPLAVVARALPVAIFVRDREWPAGAKLRVCFYGGSLAVRQAIAGYAAAWMLVANIAFDFALPEGRDCKKPDASEVRIAFASGEGNWAFIGTRSLRKETRYGPSVNLAQIDRRRVLHEFGHVLGFHHEHQSPAGRCEGEFDWPAVDRRFAAAGIVPQEIERNFRALPADRNAYNWTDVYDKTSIMHYAFNSAIFLEGRQSRCYIPQPNEELSPIDKAAAALIYPKP